MPEHDPGPLPTRDPAVADMGRRLTLAAALDRALLEDALLADTPSEQANPGAIAHRVNERIATMSEHERHKRIDRALRLLTRTEELATSLGLELPA